MKYLILFCAAALCISGCVDKNESFRITKAECWTDMMPGSQGGIYLQLYLKTPLSENNEGSVEGLTVSWDNGKYDLKKTEIEIQKIDSVNFSVTGKFIVQGRQPEVISAELRLKIDNDIIKKSVDSVKVDKVY